MIIPDDVNPTWTNRDVADASLYTVHRTRLWLVNYCVGVWPQIFSWIVVNVHPASPNDDYRFDDNFANRAIIVTVDWDKSGKGCRNSSCYSTYPERRRCVLGDSPVLFPSGNYTTVEACQPACFIKRRANRLMHTMKRDESMFDQEDPTKSCPACNYLTESEIYHTRRWKYGLSFGGRNLETWDIRTGKAINDGELTTVSGLGSYVPVDENGKPNIDQDLPLYAYDEKYNRCIIAYDFKYRTIVEPLWRDTTTKCKVTNFEIGDDVEWGVRFRENDPNFIPNYGFLVKHSLSYCRAFAKNLDQATGDCVEPWWRKVLSNTIAGDGTIHWFHLLSHPEDRKCNTDWKVNETDRDQVKIKFTPSTNYSLWHKDVNSKLIIPPPNIVLSDLGIDVRVTGNRLYWNSAEGIISQFPMIQSVEQTVIPLEGERSKRSVDNNKNVYTTYNTYTKPIKPIRLINNNSSTNENNDNDKNIVINDTVDTDKQKERLTEYRRVLELKHDRLKTRKREAQQQGLDVTKIPFTDTDLDGKLVELWTDVRSIVRNIISSDVISQGDATPGGRGNSIGYTLEMHEYLTERHVASSLVDDDKRNNSRQNQRRVKRQTTNDNDKPTNKTPLERPTMSATDSKTVQDVLNHIRNEEDKDRLREVLGSLAAQLSFDFVIYPQVKNILKSAHGTILQSISRYGASQAERTLTKIGIRIGVSRIVGSVGTRATFRAMSLLGMAGTGVGLIIEALGIASLVFDIAEIAGWDPGSYSSESSLAPYLDAARYFADQLNEMNRGPVTPFEMMNSMYETQDTIDPQRMRSMEVSGSTINTPVDNSDTKNTSVTDKQLPFDQRVDLPKWFNRRYASSCFAEKLDDEHLRITNDTQQWNVNNAFDYIGSLTTNSFGQRVFRDDDTVVQLKDNDIVDLLTKYEYESLLTQTNNINANATELNKRSKTTRSGGSLALGLALGLGGIVTAVELFTRFTAANLISDQEAVAAARFNVPFSLVVIISAVVTCLSLVFAVVGFLPVSVKTSNDDTIDTNDDNNSNNNDTEPDDEKLSTDRWKISTYVPYVRRLVGE